VRVCLLATRLLCKKNATSIFSHSAKTALSCQPALVVSPVPLLKHILMVSTRS
jgi:hypothetical protein